MAWEQEMQYRFQYTTDGRGEMAWQPTAVWRSDPSKKNGVSTPLSAGDMMDGLLGLIALTVTAAVYILVRHIGLVEHFSTVPRRVLLGITIFVSFVGSVAILETKIIKTFVKVGVFSFCGYLVLAAMLHFL